MTPRASIGRSPHRLPRASRWGLVLLAALLLAPPAGASSVGDLGGLELTPPVRRSLYRLQQAWLDWTKAFAAGDRTAADASVEEMLGVTRHLGMSHLPDLSTAAAAFAVRAAQEGDFERAGWALETARALDPKRPETAYARASIQRLDGDFLGAAASTLGGYLMVLRTPFERKLLLNNLALWSIYTLILSGALFVAVAMAVRGRRLFYDVARLYSPPLERAAADALTVVALLWPIVLPSGVLWLGLYWSILLWGYGSKSERAVLIFLWLLLGLTPGFLSYQQRSAQIALVPASRLVDNLSEERLYGALFSDLEVLRSLVPESDTVTEIVADLHRRLGQWEYARAIYTELSQDPERQRVDTATAYGNLGVYFHRRADYETAVSYFNRAIDADPSFAEAYFNLSRAHGQLFEFNEQHEAMAAAKELAGSAVDQWTATAEAAETGEESALPVDGGLRRVEELRERIDDLWRRRGRPSDGLEGLWRRWRSLGVALVALAVALVVQRLRRQMGQLSDRLPEIEHPLLDNRWVQVAIPGLASLREGRGLRAFFAILLPVGLVMTAMIRGLGYRAPLAMDPGHWLATTFAVGALVILYLVRASTRLTD